MSDLEAEQMSQQAFDELQAAKARLRDAARAWVGAEMAEGCKQEDDQ